MSASIHSIRSTPAQQTTSQMAVGAYLHAILEAATALIRMGHQIIAFHAEIVSRYPSLWLADSPELRNMVRCGHASYDRQGTDEHGSYRVGVFMIGGVVAQWLERVPS